MKYKVSKSEGKTFEYWFHNIGFSIEPRLVIEARNWKEADKIKRKLIREIRRSKPCKRKQIKKSLRSI